MMPKKILLVEDDASLGFVIKDNLEQAKYHVTLCADGEAGEKCFHEHGFDFINLYIMI